jgi:hypothetical protein
MRGLPLSMAYKKDSLDKVGVELESKVGLSFVLKVQYPLC